MMLQMHLHHPLWLFPLLAAVGGGGASGRGSSRHQGSRYQDYHQLGGAEGGGRHRQDRQTQDGSRIELQTKVHEDFTITEKASSNRDLLGTFSVITNLRVDLRLKL